MNFEIVYLIERLVAFFGVVLFLFSIKKKWYQALIPVYNIYELFTTTFTKSISLIVVLMGVAFSSALGMFSIMPYIDSVFQIAFGTVPSPIIPQVFVTLQTLILIVFVLTAGIYFWYKGVFSYKITIEYGFNKWFTIVTFLFTPIMLIVFAVKNFKNMRKNKKDEMVEDDNGESEPESVEETVIVTE